jgi:hypothetical protein
MRLRTPTLPAHRDRFRAPVKLGQESRVGEKREGLEAKDGKEQGQSPRHASHEHGSLIKNPKT